MFAKLEHKNRAFSNNSINDKVMIRPFLWYAGLAILNNFIVSNSYYGMLKGQIHTNLSTEYPIIAIWNLEFKDSHIAQKVHCKQLISFTLQPWTHSSSP